MAACSQITRICAQLLQEQPAKTHLSLTLEKLLVGINQDIKKVTECSMCATPDTLYQDQNGSRAITKCGYLDHHNVWVSKCNFYCWLTLYW